MGGRTGSAGMQAKSNMTAMKGQLGLRSSALAPTSAKLTTQYLVLDHMNNHYSKIVNAKSAIDNRPPKVLATSQKARDRKVREHVKKTGMRPGSSMNVRPSSKMMYYDEDILDDDAALNDFDPEDEDDRLVLDIMKTTLRSNKQERIESTEATYGGSESMEARNDQGQNYHSQGHSYQGQGSQNQLYQAYSHQPHQNVQATQFTYGARPSSARSVRSAASGVSRSALAQGAVRSKKVEDGDILVKRSHVFNEPVKPFTPRTLKSTRMSKLSQTKFYTPPPQKRKDQPEKMESEQQLEETSTMVKPKPRPRRARSPPYRTETPLTDTTQTTLMYESLQSRDFTKYNKEKMVPTLDISMDKDHLNWIKEQASKADIRAKSSTLKSNMNRIKENDMLDTTDMEQTQGLSTSGSLGRTTRSFGTRTFGTGGRLNEQEEELKYVEFTKQVTDDVLNRGVFTNRVLIQVFQTHIEKRKGELDEYKMRGVLDQIRRDLDIPNEPDSDPSSYTGSPDTSSRLRFTAGYTGKTSDFGISRPFDRTFNSTMDSQNTYGLQSTSGDMFSTINSEFERDEMSNTQALRSYQMDITQKDAIEEDAEEGTGEVEQAEAADRALTRGQQVEQQPPKLIQVSSRDTDNESVHSSASKSRRQHRSKPSSVISADEVQDNGSVHVHSSKSNMSGVRRSKPSSVVSAASGEKIEENVSVDSHASNYKSHGVSRAGKSSSVVSAASGEKIEENVSVHSHASNYRSHGVSHAGKPSSVASAASQGQTYENVSVHSQASSSKVTPQHRQYLNRQDMQRRSPKPQSLVSNETDDTLTRHSQALSDGETEDGAYGEDEFEESELDDQLGHATHRTSDDDF